MDYVVGSVAALISGNVTPNRPKKLKKPLTPIKHQPSPNVTPKSEFVEDRSIFLSPTMQKKKAIVKKSPKRIFQQDFDVTNEDEGNSSFTSPKGDKVKKHLKSELDGTAVADNILLSPKSPKNFQEKVIETSKSKKKLKTSESTTGLNEITLKKKKKQKKSVTENEDSHASENIAKEDENEKENSATNIKPQIVTPKKKRKKSKITANDDKTTNDLESNEVPEPSNIIENGKKKNKKKKNKTQQHGIPVSENTTDDKNKQSPKKKKKKKSQTNTDKIDYENVDVNPNAVTSKDTDSEHESDDEMESENEEVSKQALDVPPEESSDEEEKPKEEDKKPKEETVVTEDEIKRTLFVGNVPFSSKCKKEIKKIFSQYGQIDTVRIRTIPVKDARTTPKLAVIKNELHPDRSTVNVYVKFADVSSVEKALAANNTVLNDHHLRVSRSDSTGATHDPRCSVFVGNIPFALEDETLREKFVKCGEIESVRIVRDKKTNVGKGFGYVNFASKDGVELALALTEEDLTIKNRIMRVKRCTQVAKKMDKKHFNHKQSFNQKKESFKQRREPFHQKRDIERTPFVRDNQFKGKFNRNDKNDGAYRRVMNKRKNQDSGDGPPSKKQNLEQPNKEKKVRKEFVGMTAEKKKKHKFNKGQKKKKALSEILTKK